MIKSTVLFNILRYPILNITYFCNIELFYEMERATDHTIKGFYELL